MQDIYIISRNSRKVYQTRDQRLQEVALGIDDWDKLTKNQKEFMLTTCSIMGWGFREHWWELWKPKILGKWEEKAIFNF